ncbi:MULTISPECIES: replication-relaxation family protein [unclassified Mameliella]|uniref:replication-relaxation family protein n=1 Tax=unclassified Mameliella TaxID=2630630 RepID=UPI00274012C5|nr:MULTISPECIES: replication-relaxation family protein [unclassified Mameliella]
MKQTDTLGRATFHHIAPVAGVRLTEREVRWLKHIERHGPQSSQYLFELTRDTHRCKDTALRAMQKLRAAGYLRLPPQQRATERAECRPYIYDLALRGTDHLEELGIREPTVRPTGHWWHGYAVSAFTGTLDIHLRQRGCEFIPAHRILERSGADLAIQIDRHRLIPDQLYAVRYPDGYRAFFLEVDRGTEPFRSGAARKSLSQTTDLYSMMIAKNLHRQHYGLKASTLVAFVFTSLLRAQTFRDMVGERAGGYAGYFLVKTMPESLTWANMAEVHQGPWVSGCGVEVAGV